MRVVTCVVLSCIGVSPCQSAETIAGRWEGALQIPGSEFELIVDLAQYDAKVWTGSLIAPGLNIKGAALTDIVVTGDAATFTVRNALGTAPTDQAKFNAHLGAPSAMTGEFLQGGNSAAFALHRPDRRKWKRRCAARQSPKPSRASGWANTNSAAIHVMSRSI